MHTKTVSLFSALTLLATTGGPAAFAQVAAGDAPRAYHPLALAAAEAEAEAGGGGGVNKIQPFGKLPVNIQLSAFYNIETPTDGADWQLRFQAQFMFPK